MRTEQVKRRDIETLYVYNSVSKFCGKRSEEKDDQREDGKFK